MRPPSETILSAGNVFQTAYEIQGRLKFTICLSCWAPSLYVLRDYPHVVGQPAHPGLYVLGEDGHVGGHGVQHAHGEVGRLREGLVAPREGAAQVQGGDSIALKKGPKKGP